MITLYTIHNRKTKNTWSASGEEALLYCSRLYGFQADYLVYDVNAKTMTGIELLSLIFKARRKQNV